MSEPDEQEPEPRPPRVEGQLVSLGLDRATSHLRVDQTGLEATLEKIARYPKDLSRWLLQRVQFELDASMKAAKDEVHFAVKEAAEKVAAPFRLRCDELEVQISASLEKLTHCEIRMDDRRKRESRRLDEVVGLFRAQQTADTATSPEHAGGDSMRSRAQDAKSPDNASVSPAGEGSNEDTTKILQEVERLGGQVSDLESYAHSQVTRTRGDVEQHRSELNSLAQRIVAMESHMQRLDQTAASWRPRVDGVQGMVGDLQKLAAELRDELAKVTTQTDEATGKFRQQVAFITTSLGLDCGDRSVLDRVSAVEGSLKRVQRDISTHAGHCCELTGRAERIELDAGRAAEDVEAKLAGRCEPLEEHIASIEAKVGQTKEQLSELLAVLSILPTKVDKEEMLELRSFLAGIVRDLKDKEQSVLFGARCLSCNRVYDDVQTEAGSVNVHNEKQKALLWSEVQRALNSPKPDPGLIRMLAVKVGRVGNLATHRGHVEGRDASSISCGVDDVALMPLKGPWPPSSGNTVLPAPLPDRTAPVAASSPQVAACKKSPRKSGRGTGSEHGPMDFTHPLATLVSRGTLS